VLLSTGALADDVQPPKLYTETPTGVNLPDGSYAEADVDLAIGSLQLERSHLGGPVVPYSKAFGPSWTHNFEIYIRTVPSGPPMNTYYSDVHTDEGVYTFSGDASNNVNAPWNDDARGKKLEKIGTILRFTARSGAIYDFTAATNLHHISKLTYPNGRVLDFFYNSSEKLKEVRDSGGHAIIFDYAANGYIADACAVNMVASAVSPTSTCASITAPKQMVSYSYTAVTGMGGYLLTGAVDRLGQTTTYQYNNPSADKPAISCVTPPGYSACKVSNVYGSATYYYQVTQQTLATGEVWNYAYTGFFAGKRLRDSDGNSNLTNTHVTDPLGKISKYSYIDSSPYGAGDPNGNVTFYVFKGDQKAGPANQTSGTYWAKTTLPEGNSFYASFDDRMNVTGTTAVDKAGANSRSTSASFPASGSDYLCGAAVNPKVCNQPIWTRDPKGNQTDFTYDSASGGVLTEMGPAPSTGAARPLRVLTYVSYSAMIRDTAGALVSGPSMWLPATETQCQTALANSNSPVCDSAAQQRVTGYEYGSSGALGQLLMKGKVVSADGSNRRTCFTYDWQGLQVSQTNPLGTTGMSVCP
jgi:hypothetical protein